MPSELLNSINIYFENILNSFSDGVYITDFAGVTIYVNHMYEQLTGLKHVDLHGKNVRELVTEGVFDYILNPEIVQSKKPVTRVQSLNNGKRLVLSGTPIFDVDGVLRLVITFARDITMITRLHEQMDEQRKLMDQIHDQMAYITQKKSCDVERIFCSQAMKRVQENLLQVAKTDATLLILGETGVGKDVFARYTHTVSERKDKIFLKVDCGSISETLIESEMFGYARGAFTGALGKGKSGYFELAEGGTIFLDEIGELPISVQTRLLRVLQDSEIVRVGSSNPQKINVRFIAATNRDLAQCVKDGTFRSDLYYRLNVASVNIPSLRDRSEDVRPLAEYYLSMYANKYHKQITFMESTLEIMKHYTWPGNIRELQNMIHSLVITQNNSLISPRDLPKDVTDINYVEHSYSEDIAGNGRSLKDIMANMERDFLLQAVEYHGSIQKVAEIFKVNRSTIFRKLNS